MDDDDVDGTAQQDASQSTAAPGRPRHPRSGRVARQLARRRRRERLGGILIAVLGVAVLIVAFLALRHPRHPASAAGSDTRASTPAQSSFAPSTSGQTSGSQSAHSSATHSGRPAAVGKPLVVVNQSQTDDLAHQAADRFRSGGWRVTSVHETFTNDVATTTAYYDPSISGAEAAARALQRQFPGIRRVAERFAPVPGGEALPAGPVVVVLTDDYSQ